jgi:uncharacterized protein (DUF433 family)
MQTLDRITLDPRVMGGKPCIRGMRMTVRTIVGLVAAGLTMEEILRSYPNLKADDANQALSHATRQDSNEPLSPPPPQTPPFYG